MPEPRPNAALAGSFIVVVVLPLAFLPIAWWPFADPKLFVLCAGIVVLWFARLPVDRALALAALAYVAVAAIATVAGVDPSNSLLGAENQSTGLILIAATAFLLVQGRSLPGAVADRLPWWLLNTGVAAAAVEIVYRFLPGVLDGIHPTVSFVGSTLGQRGALTGFMAASIAVVPGLPGWTGRPGAEAEGGARSRRDAAREWWPWVALVLVASGLSLAAERSGWVATVVALGVCIWRARPSRWLAWRVVAITVAVVGIWTALTPFLRTAVPLSAAARFAELGANTSFGYRLTVWRVLAHAALHRPLLGWGPSNTFSAFLATANHAQVAHVGRGWGDAHDVLLETAVTTGVLGLVAFLALAWAVVARMRRAPAVRGWAAAAACALFVNGLVQPRFVTLAPILFLFAGVAGSGGAPVAAVPERRGPLAMTRAVVGAGLAICLVLSASALTASLFEAIGRLYGSEWALRTSLRVEPWRITSAESLSLSLALDGQQGDRGAAAEARRIATGLVDAHPWNPGVRLNAADVDILLANPAGAAAWVRRQLQVFPGDSVNPSQVPGYTSSPSPAPGASPP